MGRMGNDTSQRYAMVSRSHELNPIDAGLANFCQ